MKASCKWLQSQPLGQRDAAFRYAPLSEYPARYSEWGSGPPLILVPGLAGGVGLVEPLAQALSLSFHTFSYQLRGEEDWFALRRRFDMSDLADDLAEFIDGFRLERPILVGVSFGGAIALEFAARYPGKLSGLAVQGTDVRLRSSLLREVAGRVLQDYPLPSDSQFVNQFFHLVFGGRLRSQSMFDFVTRQCWSTDQSVMARRFQLAEGIDLSERLGSIRAPTLLMSGDRDLFVSEQGLEELAMGIPTSEFARIQGAGHLAFVTHPRTISNRVRRFVLEHELIPEA